MSKSLGNQFDPWQALDRQGADALRWWMLTSGSPWESRRIGHEILDEHVRQFLLPLWNVYAFFVTYANAAGIDPDAEPPDDDAARRRWIGGSRPSSRARCATCASGMDAYDATGAGRRIQRLIDDLSTWYVRRSRRRFWNPGGAVDADARAAFAHAARLPGDARAAPRAVHPVRRARRCGATSRRRAAVARTPCTSPTSPSSHEAALDPGLDDAMATARQLVELGRRVRAETKVRTRQPLAEAVAHVPDARPDARGAAPDRRRRAQRARRCGSRRTQTRSARGGRSPTSRCWARGSVRGCKALAATLAADDGTLAERLAAGTRVEVTIDDGPAVAIEPDGRRARAGGARGMGRRLRRRPHRRARARRCRPSFAGRAWRASSCASSRTRARRPGSM